MGRSGRRRAFWPTSPGHNASRETRASRAEESVQCLSRDFRRAADPERPVVNTPQVASGRDPRQMCRLARSGHRRCMTTPAIPITRWFSLTRLALPASGAAVAAGTLSFQRATANGCGSCGRSARERPTAWLGYTAFAVSFPYPALKLYWSLGGSIGRPVPYDEGFPAMELAGLVVGALLSL